MKRVHAKTQTHGAGGVPPRPLPLVDFDAFAEIIAERVVAKTLALSPGRPPTADDPLLLTVEEAAHKLGRTIPATEHLIREKKVPAVRFDRRVYIDYRDILLLIERHKTEGNI